MPSAHPSAKVWPAGQGAWQIRLPLPWALNSVNVFLFRQSDGYLLLDAGLKTEQSLLSLEAALDSLNLDWRVIARIVISHMHPDHVGAAAEIRRRSGAPIRMHPLEAEMVKPRDPDQRFFARAESYMQAHGVPQTDIDAMREEASGVSASMERFLADETIEGGDTIAFAGGTLRAVMAPGHSPAMLCFHCPEQRLLFSTDAILERTTPNIGVHWFYRGNPLGEYFNSLRTLELLDIDKVLPSHGRPFEGHREWIAGVRGHHRKRCGQILAALQGRPLHAYDIAGIVWGEERPAASRRFAMAEALAHLEYMSREGRVERRTQNGVTLWQAAAPAAD